MTTDLEVLKISDGSENKQKVHKEHAYLKDEEPRPALNLLNYLQLRGVWAEISKFHIYDSGSSRWLRW